MALFLRDDGAVRNSGDEKKRQALTCGLLHGVFILRYVRVQRRPREGTNVGLFL
jgi:hypothetical protein